jgi:ABC-type multidrug transport system fused ATPase/permease subunit
MASRFDLVVVLQKGKVVEQGSFAELNQDNTRLHALLNAA